MMIITALYSGALAILNEQTNEKILQNQKLKEQKAILYIFNIPYESNESLSNIQKLFNIHISSQNINNHKLYIGKLSNDNILGYAFPLEGNGLWGKIEGYIALSDDKEKILGIEFTSHSETPGLGGRISEEWFKEQFRNVNIKSFPDYISMNTSDMQIDSISGATQTSKAVESMINQNLSLFLNNMEVN
jgi:Na+-transporting NADH:ubiquinone oxidoreductase subunit C